MAQNLSPVPTSSATCGGQGHDEALAEQGPVGSVRNLPDQGGGDALGRESSLVVNWLSSRGLLKLDAFDRLLDEGIDMEKIAKLHESNYLTDEEFDMTNQEFRAHQQSKKRYEDDKQRAEELGQSPPPRYIPITNSEFVPDGFHEDCRDEDGSIKVTENNHHLYQDNEHLVHMFKRGLWACDEGVTYTPHEANCPEDRIPTIEAMNSLSFRSDITFKGRIVCEGGQVFDADTQHIMKELGKTPQHPRESTIGPTFQKAMEFHRVNHYQESLPRSITVSQKQSDVAGIPCGEYIRKEMCCKKGEDGLLLFALCDVPDCCLMNHVMLGICASNMMDPVSQQMTTDYFKERTMYKIEDDVNGNFDICQMCITECISE
jgi:hypothetical protein